MIKFIRSLAIFGLLMLLAFVPAWQKDAAAKAYTNLVFDLDGVLLTTDKTEALSYLGPLNLGYYIIDMQQLPSRTELFRFLTPVSAVSLETFYAGGLPLPGILVDWQTGRKPNAQIRIEIENYLTGLKGLRTSKKVLVQKLANLMFDPDLLVRSRRVIPRGAELLNKAVKSERFYLYILTNWDRESFPILVEEFPELFKLFDGVLVSGQEQTLKPQAEIYQRLLTKYDLNPDETLFIDDEVANIHAARKLGIDGIVCHNNYDAILAQIGL